MPRNACWKCPIRDVALCRALPESALAQLSRMTWHRSVRAGCRIFGPGEEPLVVANIVSGVVRLSRSLGDGRTQIVGLQFAPEFIGRPFAESGSILAEAATDVELCCFSKPQFEGLLQSYPGLHELLTQRMIHDLDQAREWMLLLGRKTALERVATLILLCAERLGAQGDSAKSEASEDNLSFQLPLSRTEMAEFLGLTLETVSRMLRKLAEAGVIAIERGRGITIRDGGKLRMMAEMTL